MRIKLKSLTLENFKGIRDMTIEFGDLTAISSQNAKGKTTLFDAFSWLLFDKDSTGRKTFGIKTFTEDGDTLHGVNHRVSADLEVDGDVITLEKIYKEKWTKKRGSATEEFTGHTTDYKINDVPMKENEYKKRIDSIIDEEKFKLLTHPLYFNEQLDHKKRREILVGLVDEVTKEDVIAANDELQELSQSKISIEETLKVYKSRASMLNKELQEIPIRMDELTKSMKTVNVDAAKKAIDEIEREIETLEEKKQGFDSKKFSRMKVLAITIQSQENAARDAQREAKANLAHQIRETQLDLSSAHKREEMIQRELSTLFEKIEKARDSYKLEASKSADVDGTCPTCHQELPEEQIQETIRKFNTSKSNVLENIEEYGKQLVLEQQALETERNLLTESINALETKYAELQNVPEPTLEYPPNHERDKEELKALEEEQASINNDEVQAEIDALKIKLHEAKTNLAFEAVNKENEQKIAEYQNKLREISADYDETQRMLYLCEQFSMTQAKLIEDKLNERFETLSFNLFKTQINGGIQEVCVATINGVPYSDANHAAQINAGIDVINTLSEKYNTYAPIWVDNAEAVNQIQETVSQLITLHVSDEKELTVRVLA